MAARHAFAPPMAPGWNLRQLEGGIPQGLRKVKNPATVRRIVAAAERIFAERGLAGARTEEIARAARVNRTRSASGTRVLARKKAASSVTASSTTPA